MPREEGSTVHGAGFAGVRGASPLLQGRCVKAQDVAGFETGFKRCPNQLDYAAFPAPAGHQMATQGRPNADEDPKCLSMPPTTRAGTSCARP